MASTTATMMSGRMVLSRISRAPAAAAVRWRSTQPSPNEKESSLLDSAAQYYSHLRWKFATSLTASLSPEEQSQLLNRLQVAKPEKPQEQKVEEEQQQHQHSIAEAVAAARAEEAQRQSAKWEQEKAQLLEQAEKAAKARVENELLIQHRRLAFDRWEQELNQQQTTQQQQQPAESIPDENDEQQQEDASLLEEPISVADHPLLGSAVVDLGYKRVHMASVNVLKSLPVWKKQRTYRHTRAESMAQDKLKTLHLGMPGIIALYEDSQGNLSIIDGQHRVGMMSILEEKQQQDGLVLDLERILVEVYPQPGNINIEKSNDKTAADLHAQDIFLEINKAEPVKLVDLPGSLSQADRKTINDGAQRLQERFPAMFSNSSRCRAPHLNLDNLREALFASEVIKRHSLKSPKALESWMLAQNELLKEKYNNQEGDKPTYHNATSLKKAIKFDFYLGLDSSWLLK